MRNWIKQHKYAALFLLMAGVALASGVPQNFPTDNVKMGIGTSADDKQFVFNTNDGAGNPTITVDMTNKDFDFNKALNIVANQMTLGDGTASDKIWIFDIGAGANNPKFQWDNALQSLSFANDGVNFKKLGFGTGSGGGGVNLLAENNFDFETASPPQDWTASGGTFIAETTSPLFGEQSGSWDASALSQTLDSVLAPITSGFLGNTCSAQIEYRYASGSAGDYILVVRQFDDSGATEITVGQVNLAVTGTNRQTAQLFFNCPDDAADDLRIRIEAGVADPGVIIIDNAFVGTGRNTQSVIAGNTIFENLLTSDVTSDGIIADLTFNNLVVGKYYTVYLHATLLKQAGAGGDVIVLIQHDGSTIGAADFRDGDTGLNKYRGSTVVTFQATATTLTFNGSSLTASDVVEGSSSKNDTYAQLILRNDITSNPSESINLATVGEHWDVNIGGANPTLGLANVAAYTSISNGSLDLVVNPGSKPAEIPCAAPNPSTGLTCSVGNENIGVVIDISTSGKYKICGEFSHLVATDAVSEGVLSTFQWVETSNTTDTIIQEGNSRVMSGISSSSGTEAIGTSINICGDFVFSSAGQKTIRLAYEQSVSGTPTTSDIRINRDASQGQRDMHITIRKMDQQQPTPVFTDLLNSLATKTEGQISNEKTCSGQITNSGTPALGYRSADCVDSLVDNGVGDVTINFNAGYFSNRPNCICSNDSNSGSFNCMPSVPDATSFRAITTTTNTAAFTDRAFQFFCVGPK